jgi:hypothetical protein
MMVVLPHFCWRCGRRLSPYKCSGWKDPSGCRGEHWASPEQAKSEEEERLKYITEYKKV